MATAATTRTEQVYARMRSDILAGHLTPGAKLPFAELVARYGGSTSVIREGLTRLVEQGLVQAEPQHGFRVVPLSISDLDDLTTRAVRARRSRAAAVDRSRRPRVGVGDRRRPPHARAHPDGWAIRRA